VFNDLVETPSDGHKSHIDALLDEATENTELWQWESMLVYHLKFDIDEIRSWEDEKFFDMVSRVRWVIKQEQKQWKSES
jgi:hypothetical protein